MAVSYDILTLVIGGSIAEKIRYFGKNDLQRTITEYKKVYNLSEDDDYVFFLTMQSKMNKRSKYDNVDNLKQ